LGTQNSREIKAARIGRAVRIQRDSLEEFMEQRIADVAD
jgi:excisionase family DNA binding protein